MLSKPDAAMKRWVTVGALLVVSVSCSPGTSPRLAHSGLLTYGDTVERRLAGSEEHHWAFVGNTGDAIDITLRVQDIRPGLILRDAEGNTLQQVPADSYPDPLMLHDVRLPEGGAYTLVIVNASDGEGRYTLTLRQLLPPTPTFGPIVWPSPSTEAALASPTPLAVATPTAFVTAAPPLAIPGMQLQPFQAVQGALEQPGQVDRYTIFGRADDVVSIGMTAVPGSAVDPHIAVYNPAGEVLATADNTFGTADAIIQGLTLPATGAYIVFAQDAGGQGRGPYLISFGQGLTMRDDLQAHTRPEVVYTGTLSQPAVRQVWTLDLNLGDVISAAVVGEGNSAFDPVLALVSPDGQTLYEDDNSGGGRNAALRGVIALQTGRFRLAIRPAEGSTPGTYTLIWRYDAQAPPAATN